MLDVEEAIAALRDEDPHLIILLAELRGAAKAAKTAKNQAAWSRMGTVLVQLLKASGTDDELLDWHVQEGHDASASGAKRVTREDLDDANLRFADGGVAFLQAAFARLLISLPIGIAGTRAGMAAAGSLRAGSAGYDPWLFGRATHQGGDASTERCMMWLANESVLAEAARLVVHSGRSRRDAIIKAVATNGAKAMSYGMKLDPELLRQRASRRAKDGAPADPLCRYFEERLQYERNQKFGRKRSMLCSLPASYTRPG
jgi:hypothetical protein